MPSPAVAGQRTGLLRTGSGSTAPATCSTGCARSVPRHGQPRMSRRTWCGRRWPRCSAEWLHFIRLFRPSPRLWPVDGARQPVCFSRCERRLWLLENRRVAIAWRWPPCCRQRPPTTRTHPGSRAVPAWSPRWDGCALADGLSRVAGHGSGDGRAFGSGGEGAEEGADVMDEEGWCFEGGEVAAGGEVAPVHDVVAAFGVAADGDVLGDNRYPGRHVAGGGPVLAVHGLVVEVGGGFGGRGEPVEAHVGEDRIARDRVLGQLVGGVGPLLELLHDPG